MDRGGGDAGMGTLGVLSANLILRPVSHLINRAPDHKEEHEILYRLACACRTTDEANIRMMLIQNVGRISLTAVALCSRDDALLARWWQPLMSKTHQSPQATS